MKKLHGKIIIIAAMLIVINNINADIIKINGIQTSNLTYTVLKDPSIVDARSIIFDPSSNGDTAYVLDSSETNKHSITKITNLKSNAPEFTRIVSDYFNHPVQLIFDPDSNSDVAYVLNSKYVSGDTFVRIDGLKSTPTFNGFSDSNNDRYSSITVDRENDGSVVIYGVTALRHPRFVKISKLNTPTPTFSDILHNLDRYNEFISTDDGNGFLTDYDGITKLTGLKTGKLELRDIYNVSDFSRFLHDFTIDPDSNGDVAYVSYGWRMLNDHGEIKKFSGLNSADRTTTTDVKGSQYDGIFILDPNNSDTGYQLDNKWDLTKITGLKTNDTKVNVLIKNLDNGADDCRRAIDKLIFDPSSNGNMAYVTYKKLLFCPPMKIKNKV